LYLFLFIFSEDWLKLQQADDDAPREKNVVKYDSETDSDGEDDNEENEEIEETESADLGGGWGRIVYMPRRRGRQVILNVCKSTKSDASEGSFDLVVVTKSKNPTLHHQAKRSIWGDLWPF
jgi:ribosomal protein RSM22 (predicted rRNA methylase)